MKGTTDVKRMSPVSESLRQAFEFWVKSEAPTREVFRDFTAESKEIRIPLEATKKRIK